MRPTVTIEASAVGVEALTVRFPRGAREAGLRLLGRVLPAVEELSVLARRISGEDQIAQGGSEA